ncbi:MAG: PDDEXK nuclease domain-containing protein [Candidatus Methanoperedenaceae archaeon]|nr:PDDEXK nuclease domain-containing protein [Candidatus Methanoperedenaceae archaeon]
MSGRNINYLISWKNLRQLRLIAMYNKNYPNKPFFNDIRAIIQQARQKAYTAVNFVMVEAYWHIGKRIVQEEQQGEARAEYGKKIIKELSKQLSAEFGRGFTEANIWNFRQFYLIFKTDEKLYALRRELTWTHYRLIMRLDNPSARDYYMQEAMEQNWSTRALERQINSLYYERLLTSRNKAPVVEEMQEKTAILAQTPQDFIKDPYVLEFLGMPDSSQFRESDLEQAIIDNLKDFILELGKGFAFVARQKRITTETSDFYIDLVFYNYLLKCFVLIDLKTGKLTHQDIGQMDMYVRLFEDKMRTESDNPTIGLLLCTEKDEIIAHYSVLKESKQLFASKYRLILPTEEELKAELEREKRLILEQKGLYEIRVVGNE